MGHAVMTHTRIQATVNYTHLPTDTQNLFDQLMDQADNTASAAEYEALMASLIAITGVTGVRHGEILKCACGCDCPSIFDADAPDALVTEPADGYNLGRLQCPDCADDHPRPVQD
ncbi:hypothetical protein [Streptomyces sp. NBC_01422]|uniref:hypothetical protein n=1 Tax=Streptomyces sp. NBC_01422 TaxID=2903859 RepID=UPI002E2D7C21|nr:hypothetical protein [Streptomyces sp. NBC_01422]